MSVQRKTQRLIDSLWKNVEFENIKSGDTFRLFEPTGETVVGYNGDIEFVAVSDAYINENQFWAVDIKGD